ncbi:MAG TPA: carboxypeptidase-like regulatory domain-containing protein [Acetobacteraceae bacterium]|nr:carboxypeptidase-like regulatory domain-containing protein [Acetobacteraceae bacterium]
MRRWRAWLLNRFVVVPVVLALIVLGWNIYVSLHAHGVIAGEVVDASGRPVAGATVTLYHLNFITEVKTGETRTNGQGRFRFTDNNSHLIELQAAAGGATSPRVTVRLWFRAQDRDLASPLTLHGLAPAS